MNLRPDFRDGFCNVAGENVGAKAKELRGLNAEC
jgi:hypothetical protein